MSTSTHTQLSCAGCDGADRNRERLQELGKAEYRRLVEPLRALAMNTLFARAVVEQDAPGRVFAYPAESPSVVYVLHSYGMSLLYGDTGIPEVNDRLLAQIVSTHRTADEWLQVSPDTWAARLARISVPVPCSDQPAPVVEQYTRVNFRFSPSAYRVRRPGFSDAAHRVARAGHAAFAMPGSVVPRVFFRDVENFLSAGTGFAVVIDDEPVSLAFSSFVTSSQLEIGIETLDRYRGRGLATLACAALIDDCLARGLEPVWACRRENTASYRLAETLGFEPVRYLPYFRLRAALGTKRE